MTELLTRQPHRNTPRGSRLHNQRSRTQRTRKPGTVLLEFALVLPLFIFFTLFSLDMGRMALVNGALSDAAYISARSGAQLGVATASATQSSFTAAAASIPSAGGSTPRVTVIKGNCTNASPYIVVEAEKDVSFITPGLSSLLNIFAANGGSVDTTQAWTLKAKGTVLCEVIR
jgi:Flp pilus assembly protein TadG